MTERQGACDNSQGRWFKSPRARSLNAGSSPATATTHRSTSKWGRKPPKRIIRPKVKTVGCQPTNKGSSPLLSATHRSTSKKANALTKVGVLVLRLGHGRALPIFILYHSSNILSSKMSHFFENISSQISKKLSSNA